MSIRPFIRRATAFVVTCLVCAPVANAADLVGLWQLDGNLNNSLSGGLSLSASGWSPTFTTTDIAGSGSQVLAVPALSPSQLLSFPNAIGANGSGSKTNSFTIGWDVNFLDLQTFESLLQTSQSNTDDVDVFSAAGRIESAVGILAPGGITGNTWYRFLLTSETTGPGSALIRFYVNGAVTGVFGVGVDGRLALDPATNYLFSDDNGETGNAQLNSFAVWNGALSASEAASLGSATTAGFAVPEPSTALLTLCGVIVTLQRRRSAPAL